MDQNSKVSLKCTYIGLHCPLIPHWCNFNFHCYVTLKSRTDSKKSLVLRGARILFKTNQIITYWQPLIRMTCHKSSERFLRTDFSGVGNDVAGMGYCAFSSAGCNCLECLAIAKIAHRQTSFGRRLAIWNHVNIMTA